MPVVKSIVPPVACWYTLNAFDAMRIIVVAGNNVLTCRLKLNDGLGHTSVDDAGGATQDCRPTSTIRNGLINSPISTSWRSGRDGPRKCYNNSS
jgi:hypothetical protein